MKLLRHQVFVSFVLGFIGSGCGGDLNLSLCPDGKNCDEPLRVATWWGESSRSFVRELTLGYSVNTMLDVDPLDPEIRKAPPVDKIEYIEWIQKQFEGANGPGFDVFLLNGGADVTQATGCAPRNEIGKVQYNLFPLYAEFTRDWVSDTFDQEVIRSLVCNDELYALPIGLHRMNHIIYNKEIINDLIETSPKSFPPPDKWGLNDLLDAAEEIRNTRGSTSDDFSVFAVPFADADTLSSFLVENVMLAIAGRDQYEKFLGGNDPNSKELI